MNAQKKISSMFILLLLATVGLVAQNNEDILKYLEGTVKQDVRYVTNGAFNQITDLVLIQAQLEVNLNHDEYGGSSISTYFVQQGKELKRTNSPLSLIELPEFYDAIKSSFTLKTAEDGFVFQTALNIISEDERNEGFFQKGNKWYFIRSEFFGRYFVVETDTNGKITSILNTKGIESNIPEEVHYRGEVKSYPDFQIPEISETDKKQITSQMKEFLEFRFEIKDGMSEFFSKISAAKFYEANFIISEQHGDETYESTYFTNLITYNGDINSSANFWETELFLESAKPVFQLKTDADAQLFQDFLNEMEAKIEGTRFYQKDDFWMFVRDNSFGEENGYIVKTDEKGNITRMSRSGFEDSDILRFRMQDPDFKVDYGFVLKSPQKTTYHYKKEELDIAIGESIERTQIEVTIDFNADAVNAMGAWILTRFNEENVGMVASSTMTSPFSDAIPVSQFDKGNHKLEYLLLSPGEDIENPLGKVVFEINIE